MKWTKEAEQAVAHVPFFVRKRVKKRVEEEARRCGAEEVHLPHVQVCQQRFLRNMEDEVRGYRIETCFGASGCPNRIADHEGLAEELERVLARRDLKSFLRERVQGPLKLHHEFRITLADCPNACSRPQIVDVGIIGARRPQVTGEPCTHCGACTETCREEAIALDEAAGSPVIDFGQCLACGQCLTVCPTGTLQESEKGYRLLVGGKLGRHPQLGRELGPLVSKSKLLDIIESCLELYMRHNTSGERFGDVLKRTGLAALTGNSQ
jgi:anaerobic sulfite reductase subunit C